MQCTMLVNLCYVSRGIGVSKVLDSKSDLQGHIRALAKVPFDRPHTIFYYCSIATMSSFCTIDKILSLVSQKLRRSHDTPHIP